MANSNTNQTLKILRWFLFLLLLQGLAASKCAAASPICALALSVVDVDGRPIASALARLLDHSGHEVGRAIVKDGWASLCDVGFGVFRVDVSDPASGCALSSSVTGVVAPSRYRTLRLKVTLNSCPGEGVSPVPHCLVYARVRTVKDQPVEDAAIAYPGQNPNAWTDAFGRLWFATPPNAKTAVEISKTGFETHRTVVDCSKSAYVEFPVILKGDDVRP